MALVLKDRVKETSTTTGTGTFTLAGAATGFQSFSVIGNSNTTFYTIVDSAAGAWEVGIGTYTSSGTTLSRDTILESSNSGSAVNFGSGSKDVFVTYPAERANVAGNGPAFSAYQSSSQSLSASVYTKLNLQAEEYDTNNNFDSTTNYRFTPTVAGYYLFTGSFEILTAQATLLVLVYKNGSSAKLLQYTAGVGNAANGSATIYMNGSTDYVELYAFSSAANSVNASAGSTYFQGSLVRAA